MKNIVITGTSRGIGLELALQFANAGHHVIAISRNKSQELFSNPNVTCITADLTSEEDLERIAEFLPRAWKKIDILIHNAAAFKLKPFEEFTAEEFEKVYRVNVFGLVALTKICLPMLESGSHVVTLSSMGGVQGSEKFSGLSAYSSSKGAVITLSELLAEEYKERGIAFNVLALGAVNTEMLQEAFPGYEAPVSAKEMGEYIVNFALTGSKYYNGKVLQVSSTTP